MASMLLKNFHPFALLIALGIFLLVVLNINSNVPLSEKFVFLALAGAIYMTVVMFESWRTNQQ